MDDKLLKPYNPKETEDKIYKLWEESGFFAPEAHPPWVDNPSENLNIGKTFSVVLPPPNVTGTLHLGHALEDSMQDLIVRYHRMRGKKVLWLPGTDHAAIATQSRVEKEIQKKEGKSRYDLGREEMLKRINKFAQESHDTIVSQVKKMGASLDWSREAFTLDEKRDLAVKTAFKKMHGAGLIYRGNRIVNWDPKGQTTISDDEIVYEERKNKFYTFKYGPFEIGTARPETKFGDKYVVMHPDDKRYKKWKHMQKIKVEWINGPIEATIIKDKTIDMEFGTGVMTITPWHSHEDFALAEKYKLDKEQIIDKFGKLLPIAQEFAGIKISDAREKIVQKLKAKGLLVSINENYINRVATAERTGGMIEPQIMLQWFVDVNKKIPTRGNKSLKELMLEPVREGLGPLGNDGLEEPVRVEAGHLARRREHAGGDDARGRGAGHHGAQDAAQLVAQRSAHRAPAHNKENIGHAAAPTGKWRSGEWGGPIRRLCPYFPLSAMMSMLVLPPGASVKRMK